MNYNFNQIVATQGSYGTFSVQAGSTGDMLSYMHFISVNNDSFTLKSLTLRCSIMSRSLNGCALECYYVVPRKDIPATENSPTLSLSTGSTEMGQATYYLQPHTTPYHVPRFVKFWKVKKVKVYHLGCATPIQLKWTRKYNRVVKLDDCSSAFTMMRNFGFAIMFRLIGNIIADAAEVAISTGNAAVDVISSENACYTLSGEENYSCSTLNAPPTSISSAVQFHGTYTTGASSAAVNMQIRDSLL